MKDTHSTLSSGKICYLEIPAVDLNRSTTFYQKVFGWNIRQRKDGSIAYRVAETLKAVVANGGKVVHPIGMDAPEITARFRDPAGTVTGLYQQPATAR